MRAATLVQYGSAEHSFEIREVATPTPGPGQIRIKVQGFGLNFADVMARLGLYQAAPPLPAILGYDVVGTIDVVGPDVTSHNIGDRVMALTRFGGYAEYVLAEEMAAVKISEDMSNGAAVALSTQYCTAYYLAYEMANLQSGDKVLIHAAAGGVGTALTQMAIHKNCEVFGTCGSEEKMDYIRTNGVHYAINYRSEDFNLAIDKVMAGERLDVIFDPVGGKSIKKGFRLLGAGGRIYSFGFSSMNQAKNIFSKMKKLIECGFYHPLQFLSKSKGMIGVNMLEIADRKPHKIARVMKAVVEQHQEGIVNPHVGGSYPVEELGAAHAFLESRKSMGKIVVNW